MADNPIPDRGGMNDSRASIDSGRDGVVAGYDRIRVPSQLRDDILSGINDSSTSLGVYADGDDDDVSPGTAPSAVPTAGNAVAGGAAIADAQSADNVATTTDTPATAEKPAQKRRTSRFFSGGGSKLKESVKSADLETPRAEKGDPLAKKGAQLEGAAAAETGNTGASGGGNNGLLSPSTANHPGEGDPLSQVSTRDDRGDDAGSLTGSATGSGAKRPGTMRRLTSRIKRTISSKG